MESRRITLQISQHKESILESASALKDRIDGPMERFRGHVGSSVAKLESVQKEVLPRSNRISFSELKHVQPEVNNLRAKTNRVIAGVLVF